MCLCEWSPVHHRADTRTDSHLNHFNISSLPAMDATCENTGEPERKPTYILSQNFDVLLSDTENEKYYNIFLSM